MTHIGKYCKAYYARELRKFPDFPGRDADDVPSGSPNDDILFIHEDLLVTEGIAREKIVFRGTGADWEKFCRQELGFEPPAWCTEEDVKAVQP